MFEEFEEMETTIRSWAWECCPFCSSNAKPKTPHAQLGGYQKEIVLQCPDCNKSIKFTTDWSPTVTETLVSEFSKETVRKLCPYLSIQKTGDNEYLLRCCAQVRDECLGKDPDNCDCYHYTKLKEYLQTSDLGRATVEAETAIKLFKQKHPDWAPPNGMNDLIEIKRKTLGVAWVQWVNCQISDAERDGDFRLAAWIAFTMAETYGKPEFWQISSDLFNKLVAKLKLDLKKGGFWEQEKLNKEIMYAEIMGLEALSEVSTSPKKAALLIEAGDKRHQLFKNSFGHYSTPEFLLEARCFVDYALAEPEKAPDYYKKASDFLLSILSKLEYERQKIYYEGHAKFFLGLYYLSLANLTPEERITLLEKSVEAFDEAIDTSKRIHMEANGVIVIADCVRAVIQVEKFTKTQDFKYIEMATNCLEQAKKISPPQDSIVRIIDSLLGIYKQVLSAVEKPHEAIYLVSQARRRLEDFSKLIPMLELRNTPIPNILDSQHYYLKEFVDVIAKNAPCYAGKSLTFNNISASLHSFKDLVEGQLYDAFKVTPEPREEIGRSLIQALFCSSFPNKNLQFREVPVAEGRSDNMLIVGMEKYPFEVKIWHGQEYYKKGLDQIKYYIDKENVGFGFYIIFDPRIEQYRSDEEVLSYGDKKIYQIFIHINNKKSV
jgi:hypothetical protein